MALRSLLIANAASGQGRTGRRAEDIARALRARGLDIELGLTSSAGDAADAAARAIAAGCQRIIVAGGDGTINSVVGVLAHAPAALGIIPTGMANAFAREMGIPLAVGKACDVAAGGYERTIDVGRAAGAAIPVSAGRHFALMAGVGFDADVVAHVHPWLKRATGPGAYVAAGIARLLRYRPARLCLRWDEGELTVEALMLVAANTARYTYGWSMAPEARCDDGLLDVVVFGVRRRLDVPAHVAGVLIGRHGQHPAALSFRTRRVRVECDQPLPLQVDGDLVGQGSGVGDHGSEITGQRSGPAAPPAAPLEIETIPGALRVLAPPV